MASIEKTCVTCGAKFMVPEARALTASTCSQPCRGKLIAKRYEAARAVKTCAYCEKSFSVPQSHAERSICCSMTCARKMPDRNKSQGADHYMWKGGVTLHSDGYVYLLTSNHPFGSTGKYVFEHRLVMEAWMRDISPDHRFLVEVDGVKYLRPEIDVHHINEDKRDNRIKNLLACTHEAHKSIHTGKAPMQGEVWPDVPGMSVFTPFQTECECGTCGVKFMKPRADVERGSGKYCSRDCYNKRNLKT